MLVDGAVHMCFTIDIFHKKAPPVRRCSVWDVQRSALRWGFLYLFPLSNCERANNVLHLLHE